MNKTLSVPTNGPITMVYVQIDSYRLAVTMLGVGGLAVSAAWQMRCTGEGQGGGEGGGGGDKR